MAAAPAFPWACDARPRLADPGGASNSLEGGQHEEVGAQPNQSDSYHGTERVNRDATAESRQSPEGEEGISSCQNTRTGVDQGETWTG